MATQATKQKQATTTTADLERPSFAEKYENFIGGKFQPPVDGEYFENVASLDGSTINKSARSNGKDINLAIDAATQAFVTWSTAPAAERAAVLQKVADVMQDNIDYLARIEAVENGKAYRETLNADLPLAIDHFRYFASVIRAEEGSATELDANRISINIKEPVGVVGQIIPWNFPLLMATWKIAPALAAGCTTVVKPAEQTPASILVLMDLLKDVLPPGILNIVTGFGPEAGKPLAQSSRVSKVAFTGETTTGRLVMQYASENLNPVTMELGGKSPNIFFKSILDADDAFFDKCIEGAVMFALNQGEVCTCPSRILVQEDIYEPFMERVIARTQAIKVGHPLNSETMMGAQVSKDQYEKILSYIDIGKKEGAEVLTGGEAMSFDNELANGFYVCPTIFRGNNSMRIFQEEIFGPVTAVTTFKDVNEALSIANDTLYGLGAGVWTRNAHELYQVPRAIKAGRVWVNCYHDYPAHAPFGGYKKSGFGRENHLMMMGHYRQNKNMLISYDHNKLGFF